MLLPNDDDDEQKYHFCLEKSFDTTPTNKKVPKVFKKSNKTANLNDFRTSTYCFKSIFRNLLRLSD